MARKTTERSWSLMRGNEGQAGSFQSLHFHQIWRKKRIFLSDLSVEDGAMRDSGNVLVLCFYIAPFCCLTLFRELRCSLRPQENSAVFRLSFSLFLCSRKRAASCPMPTVLRELRLLEESLVLMVFSFFDPFLLCRKMNCVRMDNQHSTNILWTLDGPT